MTLLLKTPPASEDPPASDPPASEDPPGPDDNGDPEAPAADATAAAAAAIPVDLARSWPLVTIEEQLLAIAPHVWRKHFRHCYELYKAVAIGVSPSTHGVVLCIDEWFSNRNFPDYIIEATNMFLMKELSEDPYNLRCATGGTSHQCLRSLVLSLFVRKNWKFRMSDFGAYGADGKSVDGEEVSGEEGYACLKSARKRAIKLAALRFDTELELEEIAALVTSLPPLLHYRKKVHTV